MQGRVFMKKFTERFAFVSLILMVLLFLAHCGAGSPPASIPAPVANFMTATPPAGGPPTTTVISGAPNTVQPNSTVTLANLTQGGTTTKLHRNLFIGSAYAQTAPFVQVQADGQGAFTAPPLTANVGDDVGVRYRNAIGDFSDEVVMQVPCGPPGSPTQCQAFQTNP
jgi:hypothetical protein